MTESVEWGEFDSNKQREMRIKNMCVGYMRLMIDCGLNDDIREAFFKNPRPFLNKIGMTIDEKIKIRIDTNVGFGWPRFYIKTPEEKILILEKNNTVDIYEADNEDALVQKAIEHEHVEVDDLSKLEITIKEDLDECKVVAVLPFMDIQDDILTEIKFGEDSEILLTVC